MMGYSHSVSAAAAWFALNESGLIHVHDTPTLIVTTLVAAGAGMLPDIDHHRGTIAHSIPPISRWVARLAAAASGGHRKGTHSIVGLAVFWGLACGADRLLYQGIPLLALALTGFAGGLALRVFKAPGGWLGAIGLSVATLHLDALTHMPWAILTGATIHVLGDALTVRGVNPFWPLTVKPAVASMLWRKSGYMALPLLGEAGSARENILTSILTLYIGAYTLAQLGVLNTYPLEGVRALLSL
ncbi:metal-dependent hydrolase [Rothia endophytica]|uniref:metal-dependent hydrolase n=1 Tax=Rothia endophytica TaxID=1324766 RepID=UPI001F2CA1C7|nr:metal-dependent hydrolase [Rothia endophytica]